MRTDDVRLDAREIASPYCLGNVLKCHVVFRAACSDEIFDVLSCTCTATLMFARAIWEYLLQDVYLTTGGSRERKGCLY